MKIIEVNLGENSYNIYIGRNILSQVVEFVNDNLKFKPERIAVITDSNVKRLYGKALQEAFGKEGKDIQFITVEPGEESKCLSTLEEVYKQFSEMRISREDLIITFGGGVVGDLGGFAASTYLRGVSYIGIPTSLLAQVDSSIGGKVAIDLPWGKNLVGSFYHPKAVFIDPEVLKTLNRRVLHDGLAEVIKYGCIKDEKMFSQLFSYENDEILLNNIDEIIFNCCLIKKSIVEKDEKDFGERMLLNFGHTLGHAIEKLGGYRDFTHGEAVGLGMLLITQVSEKLGIAEKGTEKLIEKLLTKYELPVQAPELDKKEVLKTIELDKKGNGKMIKLIMLKKIGEGIINNIELKQLKLYL